VCNGIDPLPLRSLDVVSRLAPRLPAFRSGKCRSLEWVNCNDYRYRHGSATCSWLLPGTADELLAVRCVVQIHVSDMRQKRRVCLNHGRINENDASF
jgi:hypothetical protein